MEGIGHATAIRPHTVCLYNIIVVPQQSMLATHIEENMKKRGTMAEY